MSAIEIQGLSKDYPTGFLHLRRVRALDGLSLTVERGEIFGFLGGNGAGKTTAIKILMRLMTPTAGSLRILGHDSNDQWVRARIGYLPEQPYFYDYLTARELLEYCAELFGYSRAARRARAMELLRRVHLDEAAWNRQLRKFSKGMLQRVGLAQALVNDPELVILDEPMSGLDPIGRHMVRQLIMELKDAGKTVFFSTHILPDAETLCDRVALLRGGVVVAAGPLNEILSLDVAHMEVLVSGLPPQRAGELGLGIVQRGVGERRRLEVPEGSLARVVQQVEESGGRILSVQPVRQSLEELFVREMAPEGGESAWEA
jgi:ABC-2 type transport system ATP-binding protein